MGRAVAGVLLLGLIVAGIVWGPDAVPRLREWMGAEAEVEEASPDLAEATLDAFETFQAGEGPGRLALGDAQLSSVVRYALPGILPPGVVDPSVAMSDGKIHLSARVATAAFPDLPSLNEVVGFLPDTVDIRMRGSLLPYDDVRAALHVDQVTAMNIPLPDRFIPQILAALGRSDRQGLPPDAMLVPLPEGLESAYVLRDSLVLIADR